MANSWLHRSVSTLHPQIMNVEWKQTLPQMCTDVWLLNQPHKEEVTQPAEMDLQ